MKQIHFVKLLFVAVLACGSLNAWGADVTYEFSKATNNPGNAQDWTYDNIDTSTKWEATKGGQNTPKYYSTGTGLRVYNGGKFTISSTKVISSITLTFSDTEYTFSSSNKTNPQTVEPNANSYSWKVSQTCRLQKIEITYSSGSTETTNYTVQWKVGGQAHTAGDPTTSVKSGEKVSTLPTAPADDAISDCADTFMGWSTHNLGSEKGQGDPGDLFTTAEGSPVITQDTIFYAVFATGTTN